MTQGPGTDWDAEAVLAASNDWAWVPDEARSVRTDEYIVVAYPDYNPTPTSARILRSERDATELIDEMHDIARGFGRTRVWWGVTDGIRDDIEAEVMRRGGAVVEQADILALPLDAGVPDLGVPADVEVRRIVDVAALRDAMAVAQLAFEDSEVTEEMVADALPELLRGNENGSGGRVLARVDGRSAATGGWTLTGPVARLWGGSTHPDLRGRGAYRAVLAERLRLAAGDGATLGLTHGRITTSSPILRRIGFTRYGETRQVVLDLP